MDRQELDIINFNPFPPLIGTGGQPTREQFSKIRKAGYAVVINLAMPDSNNALEDEAQIVRGLGMIYVPIPVVWTAPKLDDVEAFFSAMKQYTGKKILVHCALNYRASIFTALYRSFAMGVNWKDAYMDACEIWEPDEIWSDLINGAIKRFEIAI